MPITNYGNPINQTGGSGGGGSGDIESVTAGAGLTGGGTSGAVTLAVGAGTGITVAADSVSVNYGTTSTTAYRGDLGDAAAAAATAAQSDIDAHAALTNNPHSVTASQAGAVPATQNDSGYVLKSESITTGTTQPLSIADSVFSVDVAGGSVSGSGVVGVVAIETSSSSTETGSGAGEAGLGSNNPLTDAAFAGQRGISVELLGSDAEEIVLADVLTGAVTDLNQKVYGYLSRRTDLAANSRWRLWFYYRRESDGAEVAFTPNVSLTNAKLYAPQVFAMVDRPVAAGLGAVLTTGRAAAIGPGAVGSAELASNAVTTAKITDANVTTAKIADSNVTTAKIADSSITAAKISGTSTSLQLISRNGADLVGRWQSDRNNAVFELYEEFLHTHAAGVGSNSWNITASGTGAGTTNQGAGTNYVDDAHPGVIESATGSTATGHAPVSLGITGGAAGTIQLSATNQLYYRTLARSATLSSASQEYTGKCGFHDNAGAGAAATDGIYIDWTSASPNNGNYRGVAVNNGSSTTLDLGVGPTAATWMQLEIDIVNAVATFYTSGVSRGTISTNLPTGAGRLVGILQAITKTVGTNNLGIAWDYVSVRQILGSR